MNSGLAQFGETIKVVNPLLITEAKTQAILLMEKDLCLDTLELKWFLSLSYPSPI